MGPEPDHMAVLDSAYQPLDGTTGGMGSLGSADLRTSESLVHSGGDVVLRDMGVSIVGGVVTL